MNYDLVLFICFSIPVIVSLTICLHSSDSIVDGRYFANLTASLHRKAMASRDNSCGLFMQRGHHVDSLARRRN